MKLACRMLICVSSFVLFCSIPKASPQESAGVSIPGVNTSAGISDNAGCRKLFSLKGNSFSLENLELCRSAGFILPGSSKGGVLRIAFSALPSVPPNISFKIFPHATSPAALALESEKVEVQVPKGQTYIYLSIVGTDILNIDKIEFIPEAALSEPGECDCQQIKLSLETRAKVNQFDLKELMVK